MRAMSTVNHLRRAFKHRCIVCQGCSKRVRSSSHVGEAVAAGAIVSTQPGVAVVTVVLGKQWRVAVENIPVVVCLVLGVT